MNGYERVTAALELKEPDQVPIMEWSIHPKVIEGICPGCDLFEFVERIDLDGISVGGGHLRQHTDTVGDIVVNQWGVRFARTAENYTPIGGPIRSEADLEQYVPPDPHHKEMVARLQEAVERFKGNKFVVYHSRSGFMAAAELRGLPNLLMDFVINPELAHGVMKMVNDYYCLLARRAAEVGADAVMLGDDWAFNTAPFMSPSHFREFVLPYFKRTVQTCKEAGVYVIKHSDGNIWPIIDMVVESGIDAINPIQPEAMDIGEAKQKYGDRVCISGNVNCGHTLSEAPVEQVVREVKEAIRRAGPGGGYIMMSSNSLHSSVRPENYKAMVEATRTYGKYPLDMASLP